MTDYERASLLTRAQEAIDKLSSSQLTTVLTYIKNKIENDK